MKNMHYFLFFILFQLLKNHLNMNVNVYNTSSEKDVKISKFHKYFLDSELKEVQKKIEKQIIKDASIINLPQENYETFKNILLSKFPNAKF